MFFIACKNGFVKDFNGRLIYSADIRNAKPFMSHREAYQFVQSTALSRYYYAILSSDGPYNVEMEYQAWDESESPIGRLVTDDVEEAFNWIKGAQKQPDCVLITQSCEMGDVYIERDIWSK